MKILGADFLKFLNDIPPDLWERGIYWNSDFEEKDINPLTKYDVTSEEIGSILSDGHLENGSVVTLFGKSFTVENEGLDVATLFRAWKKTKEFATVLVEIPNERLTEVLAYLKATKCSVSR